MANAQPEPSMDEILASIRRIIAEDEPAQQADAPTPPPVPETVAKAAPAAVQKPAVSEPEERAGFSAEQEESAFADSGTFDTEDEFDAVFDQSETVAEEPAPQVNAAAPTRLEPEVQARAAAPQPQVTPEPSVTATAPVQAETQVQQRAEPVEPVLSNYSDAALQAGVATTPRIVRKPSTGQGESAPAQQQTRVEEAFQPEEIKEVPESVLSDSTVATSTTAFAALEENIRLSNASSDTLQDVVERMLEPMLQQWLDNNLSRIVEEKVEDEVRRISRRR